MASLGSILQGSFIDFSQEAKAALSMAMVGLSN